jgi:hypothetical protein
VTSCGAINSNQKEIVIVSKPYLICPQIRNIPKDEQQSLLSEYESLNARNDKSARVMQSAFNDYGNMREKARECERQNLLLKKDGK